MTMEITREKQIELMETARARHAERTTRRLADPTVRKVLTQPAPGQQTSSYVRTDSVMRHCA